MKKKEKYFKTSESGFVFNKWLEISFILDFWKWFIVLYYGNDIYKAMHSWKRYPLLVQKMKTIMC